MDENKKKQHGGQRDGAGRKRGEYPPQVLRVKGTNEELARIRAALGTRERVVRLLAGLPV